MFSNDTKHLFFKDLKEFITFPNLFSDFSQVNVSFFNLMYRTTSVDIQTSSFYLHEVFMVV